MLKAVTRRSLVEVLLVLFLLSVVIFALPRLLVGGTLAPWNDRLSTFATIFLGIFLEAAPFLFLGALASGMVEVFVNRDSLVALMPRNALLSALAGSGLGLVFPVCDCGTVPLARRLLRKGFPVPAGIAFLLSAPVLNPIVIIATGTAFGFGRVLLLRVGLTVLIALITGVVFSVSKTPWEILRPTAWINKEEVDPHFDQKSKGLPDKLRQVFLICTDEFFDIGRFLVIGSLLAAGMQTFIPQSVLLSIGTGPLTSVLVMVSLAILLSICSTVDAFVALGFASTFSTGSILAFLIFGPMVDIKTTFLLFHVFRKRTVMYLILLPLLLSILSGLIINLFIGG